MPLTKKSTKASKPTVSVAIGDVVCVKAKVAPTPELVELGVKDKITVVHYGKIRMILGDGRVVACFQDKGGFGQPATTYERRFKVTDNRFKLIKNPSVDEQTAADLAKPPSRSQRPEIYCKEIGKGEA